MPTVKIVTINLLTDLSRWEERRTLLVQGLERLEPDLVAVQEVHLPENNAKWLADQLSFPNSYLSPKSGFERDNEGIAILSRLPVDAVETLDLKSQNRVAQYVRTTVGDQALLLANGHFYWQPGESNARRRQVGLLIDWLNNVPGEPLTVVCGDFNGTPETKSIQFMREHFISAYAAIHGREPEYTCPTPLPRSPWSQLRTLLGFFVFIRPKHLNLKWRGTLDYIFVDPRVKILDSRLVLNQPDPDNPKLYPSDHFGLYAEIEIGVL